MRYPFESFHVRSRRWERPPCWLSVAYSGGAGAQGNPMTFFVTSAGPGKGADFGGLGGADQHCQALASAAGAGSHTWHAYLSTTAAGGAPRQCARPHRQGTLAATPRACRSPTNVAELHGDEQPEQADGADREGRSRQRPRRPLNMHDILTGSHARRPRSAAGDDMTCGNWTKSGASGSAMLGHHDRTGWTSRAGQVVEFVAPKPRLQLRRSRARAARVSVLLRGQLSVRRSGHRGTAKAACPRCRYACLHGKLRFLPRAVAELARAPDVARALAEDVGSGDLGRPG